ncbi:HxlR family transcriptional regulator [Tumebacillus sp. BK434]|uniref:winged helix-turn-helix transcriptional regulator n=1 Tax=Tumebacillus sp. BK434 TaxID=2512169 RepID=UPI001048F1F0|nr:helix-turn-helix domain-containing protein [Tumebacillus sp. BK434]TCP52916.1 HxlR family transcriptional regulator [Tumebacillus sp. BK434]
MAQQENQCCPIEVTLGIIGKKWTVLIIRELFDGKKRFSEIASSLPISSKLLTERLKELEEHGIIDRTLYPEIPPRVEYTLTESGKTLSSVLDALRTWGADHYAARCEAEAEAQENPQP